MEKEQNSTVKMNRRGFLSTGAAAAVGTFTVIPSHLFAAGKSGQVPPSDRIRLLHIGCGSQGLSELETLLKSPAIDVVGVADPNRESYNYIHWSEYGLRDSLRRLMGEPAWKEGAKGIPGGRNIMKEVVDTYYRKNRPGYKGSTAVAEDCRELLETLRDVDAVKIMSPDHHHAYQAIDCLKRGKHVAMHKPLGNKMAEAMKVVDVAKASPLSTHMLAYNSIGDGQHVDQVKKWIEAGAIGRLREIHNWSNRPVWPQYPVIP
ncbi:MAG: Gfo/Idh/MocA family oxidoreductase, partial [Tannerella sp.]|nr:Gfo/Idh/MocA family oxidoreductase [Tannerella sp.]